MSGQRLYELCRSCERPVSRADSTYSSSGSGQWPDGSACALLGPSTAATRPAARPSQGHARGQWLTGSHRQRHMASLVLFRIALWLPASGQCQIWIIFNLDVDRQNSVFSMSFGLISDVFPIFWIEHSFLQNVSLMLAYPMILTWSPSANAPSGNSEFRCLASSLWLFRFLKWRMRADVHWPVLIDMLGKNL